MVSESRGTEAHSALAYAYSPSLDGAEREPGEQMRPERHQSDHACDRIRALAAVAVRDTKGARFSSESGTRSVDPSTP